MFKKNPYFRFLCFWGVSCLIFWWVHDYALSAKLRADLHYPVQQGLVWCVKNLLYLWGEHAQIQGHLLLLSNSRFVSVGEPCSGLPICLIHLFWASFWPLELLRSKLGWLMGGLALIQLLNVVRILLLALVLLNDWQLKGPDHHFWFNLLLMIGVLAFWALMARKTLIYKIPSNTK